MDESIITGFQTEDFPTLLFVYLGTNVSIGFMIGWGVSLLIKCGRFDTQMYIDQVLKAYNCTNPPNTSYCYDTQRIAAREATNQSLKMCFYYCGWGTLWGLIFTFVTLCFACSVWQKQTLKNCAKLVCEKINQCFFQLVEQVYQWRVQFLHRNKHGSLDATNCETGHTNVQNLCQPLTFYPPSPKSPLTPRPLESLNTTGYNVLNESHPNYEDYSPPLLNYIHTHQYEPSQSMQHYISLSPRSPLTPQGL
jgi:hypothetical protein